MLEKFREFSIPPYGELERMRFNDAHEMMNALVSFNINPADLVIEDGRLYFSSSGMYHENFSGYLSTDDGSRFNTAAINCLIRISEGK